MSDKAPSPQSVVVPVEPTREMLNAAVDATAAGSGMSWSNRSPQSLFDVGFRAMLASAPAPSSLAGGEVDPLVQRLAYGYAIMHSAICNMAGTSGADGRWYYNKANEAFGRVSPIHSITEESNPHVNGDYFSGLSGFLAALSPEAPARDGSRIAELEFELSAKTHTLTIADEQIERLEARIKALTPRHEAPAEGAGEVFGDETAEQIVRRWADWINDVSDDMEQPEWGGKTLNDVLNERDFLIRHLLRARSSAPEARDGEAVAWRRRAPSNHQWTLFDDAKDADFYRASGRYTVEPLYAAPSADKLREAMKTACDLLAERTYGHAARSPGHNARLVLEHALATPDAPEAREEALGNLLAVIHGDGGHRALEVGTKQAALEAEKIVAGLFAAPSADKLRIAVEALERIAHEPRPVTRAAMREYAAEALAALKGEA